MRWFMGWKKGAVGEALSYIQAVRELWGKRQGEIYFDEIRPNGKSSNC